MSRRYAIDTSFCVRSRLLQGGALSDREEADAIRELEVSFGKVACGFPLICAFAFFSNFFQIRNNASFPEM